MNAKCRKSSLCPTRLFPEGLGIAGGLFVRAMPAAIAATVSPLEVSQARGHPEPERRIPVKVLSARASSLMQIPIWIWGIWHQRLVWLPLEPLFW